jgi:molybdate transport system substrate-binding protein
MRVSAGSTGQLYSQIRNGAPFDILLAADDVRPQLLAEDDIGDAASVFTYAIGRLALWSTETERADGLALVPALSSDFRWFAIAEPDVAPYGTAARQVLDALGAWDAIQTRLVRGQNIAQTFAMVETGNAELGLVALSQALSYDGAAAYVVVAQDLHGPIRQNAILLNRGRNNLAAVALMQFLRSAEARAIIEASGYSTIDAGN